MNERLRFQLLISPHPWSPYITVLSPLRSLYTPSAHCVDSSPDYSNTSVNCIDFFVDCANKSDDCVNALDDWTNTSVDSSDTLDNSSWHVCFPNPSLMQLFLTDSLVICGSAINIMLTARSSICSSSSLLRIYGFYMSQASSSTSIWKSFASSPLVLCSQYTGICCSYLWTSDSMYL
jgi:hypothetical protein